jgi:hypothetical protein
MSIQERKLFCPYCGFDYVHFGKPTFNQSDSYTAWDGMGNAIYIPMSCEGCPKLWDIVIGHHKGASFIFTRRKDDGDFKKMIGDREYNDPPRVS